MTTQQDPAPRPAPDPDEPAAPWLDDSEYASAFGESLARTLDPDTWPQGVDLQDLLARTEREIQDAVAQQDRVRGAVREKLFHVIATRPGAPKNAGVWRAPLDQVERAQRGLLFNGAVEASDGSCLFHESLPITIAQLAVCLVSYNGSQGSWSHRIYRRDLRVRGMDPETELLELLERRRARSGVGEDDKRDTLSQLAQRGILAYMERAILAQKSAAPWRMGHGNPAPYELLTGSGHAALLAQSLDLLNGLLAQHRKFVYVPSAPARREWLTIGDALQPMEFAIIDTLKDHVETIRRQGHYRGDAFKKLLPSLEAFEHDVASRIVLGVYRVSQIAPPYLFYAHEDHVMEAALIVLGDSLLQQHRGFPMLIEMADRLCAATYGGDSLGAAVQLAYARAGVPLRYMAERDTRR